MSLLRKFMWLRSWTNERRRASGMSSISYVEIVRYSTSKLNVLTDRRWGQELHCEWRGKGFCSFLVPLQVSSSFSVSFCQQPATIILKINKSSHQILLFLHCTIRCTIMSVDFSSLLPLPLLLEQSTLLSGFQTYVTATSSSDDIYCERRRRKYNFRAKEISSSFV